MGVVGGGIHGVSAAFHLARRGVRTVLFERATPASGPTGRSSAISRAFYTNTFLAEVARDSIAMFEDFAAWTDGRDAGHHRTGLLFLHPPEDVAAVEAAARNLNSLGVAVELVSPTELTTRFPELDVDGVGVAAWEPRAGYADPASSTMGLFERAKELGLVARLRTPVTRVEPTAGGGGVIVADDGSRTSCDAVLVAAGPWTRALLRTAGIDLPLTVERHIVATFAWGAGERIPFAFADLPGGYYCRPEGHNLFCVGPVHAAPEVDPDDFDESVSYEETEALAEAVYRRSPMLHGSEARGGWASLYDVSPDWQPVIGAVGDGIFVDAGTSGHGFKLAPALGAHVAAMVTGADTDPRLREFSPRRFEDGALLSAGYGEARILG